MLAEPIDDPDGTSPAALLGRYREAMADAVESLPADDIVEATGLDPDAVDAIGAGDVADLDLRDAAAVLSLRADAPDADSLLVEVRDHLLLEMSSGMLTVDRIAADVEGDLDPKEVQGKIEGRHPLTLAEYARLHHYVSTAR